MAVPLFATKPVLEPLLAEVAERQRAVLESGKYILGPEVEAFESEFAAYVGASTASASPTAPTRSRSRCAPPGSARATRSSSRR